MSTAAITVHHQDEIAKFLKFFRAKLKTHLENVEADFDDTRSDRLSSDDVYSQKDIKDVLHSLCFAVQANVRSELQDTINMMALLLRQLFADAEASRLALELDMSSVEDKDLLARVEKLSVGEWASAAEDSASSAKAKTKANALKLQQLQEAEASARAGREAEALARQREKDHAEEIREARHTSRVQQEEHEREMMRLQRQLSEARDTIDALELRVEAGTRHVAQTKQFQSLKRMVTQKNQQLDALRRRLQRYEPDAHEDDGETKNADEEDEEEDEELEMEDEEDDRDSKRSS